MEQSIPFISDDSYFFRLKTLQLRQHSFLKKTGLDLWHRRLGHVANESILRTVEHSIGIQNLPKKLPRGVSCPDCMIGKCQRQDLPASRTTRANDPLAQVNWDLMMVNEVSIEGYRYAMILTDSFSGFIWVYGLKTKGQTLGALKKWHCDVAPIRAKHPLITLMRDNAGENRSQDIEDFIQSIHVQSRYSAPYEQWQDGQPETAIRTLTRLVRSMKNESGVGV